MLHVVEHVRGTGSSGIEGEFRNRADALRMEIQIAQETGAKRVNYDDLMQRQKQWNNVT